ncbi:MAG: hypothetical protein WBL61_11465 [Bryobacteraceae bacterium]
MLLLGAGASASADEWERIHGDFRKALLDLSGRIDAKRESQLPDPAADAASPVSARVVVVGFTGGLIPYVHNSTGVAMLTQRINGIGDEGVAALLFGRGGWRQAAAEVLKLAHSPPRSASRLPQPLIVACGHSLGANAMGKFVRLLGESGLEVSLAVYIDAFSAEKPRVPANVACAINFYQRSGMRKGIPVRGQPGLVASEPARTTLLGSYLLKPRDKPPKARPQPLRRLFMESHYLLPYDARVQGYVCDSVRILLQLSAEGTGDGPRTVLPLDSRVSDRQ